MKLSATSLFLVLIISIITITVFAEVRSQGLPLVCGDTVTEDTTLTDNLTNCAVDGLTIIGNNIVLDCGGHSIVGLQKSETHGIYVTGSSNIIRNCDVSNFTYGVYLSYANYNTFTNTNVSLTSGWTPFWLDHSNNNIIENSTIGPPACSDCDGLYLWGSSNNTIRNNHIMQFSSGEGVGIFLDHNSTYNTVFNNEVESNVIGIELNDGGDYNNISSNRVYNNSDKGINFGLGLVESENSYNTLSSNNVYDNNIGAYLLNSSSNNFTNNNIVSTNSYSIGIDEESRYNIFSLNNITSINYYGVWMRICPDNTFSSNHISSILIGSYNDTFYNNFINTSTPIAFGSDAETYGNKWNTTLTAGTNIMGGAWIGGNFYANTSGTGFSENCADVNGDGICDLNYTLDVNNIDYLPLSENVSVSCGSTITDDTTLTSDLNCSETGGNGLSIGADNIVLDCAGHSITGGGSLNSIGIGLTAKSGDTIENCIVNNFYYGIFLSSSPNNILINNTMSDNTYNFGISGAAVSHYYEDIRSSNTVDGKPIYYYNDTSDVTIPSDAGFVGLVSSNNVTASDLTLTNNYYGILLVNTNNSLIANSNMSSNRLYGVYVYSSSNNNVTNNTETNNYYGISLDSSANNNVVSNMADRNNYYGIRLVSSSNNVIANNNANYVAFGGLNGIDLWYSSNNNITDNNVSYDQYAGIWLEYGSNGNIIANNVVNYNGLGGIVIFTWGGPSDSGNTIANNTANHNTEYGISLQGSPNNILTDNKMSNNGWANFEISGYSISDYYENIDSSNTVDGKPIYYYNDTSDVTIPSDAGFVGLISCDNMIVNGLTLTNNYYGILVINTTNSVIANNNVSNNYRYGIYTLSSSDINITNNTASNTDTGINLLSSSNNILSHNTASNNDEIGIDITSGSYNTIENNTANNNNYGISLGSNSNNNIITENNLNHNDWYGVELSSNSNDNTFTLNNFCFNNGDYDALDGDANSFSGDYCRIGGLFTNGTATNCSVECDITPPEAFFFRVPNPDQYENFGGRLMIFTGGVNNITGYVNDAAYWNVTLLQNGIFNSTICSGEGAVDGVLCTWNSSEVCSGECENFTFILNATDLNGNYNDTSQIPGITIDNTPPVLGNTSELIRNEDNYTMRVNISDAYLKDVSSYILNESNFTLINFPFLCNEAQGNDCDRPQSGTFDATWYKEFYSLNETPVPVYYTYCMGCDVVPGCFKQNASVGYDCGCLGNDCEQQTKFYLIYNSSVRDNQEPLLGLGNDEWCDQNGCVINTSLIENGVSTFMPRLESFNASAEGNPWTYYNASGITLYSIRSNQNKNLTFENANGIYKFMFSANDFVMAQNSIYQSFGIFPPWINVDKSVLNGGYIYVGNTTQFLINITNTGQAAITNISVIDIFDSGLNYTAASIGPDVVDYSGRTLTWNNVLGSNLSPGDSILLYVNFSAISSAQYVSNIVNVTAVDEFENTTNSIVSSTISISQNELAITGLPSWMKYDVINGKSMTFVGGLTDIYGYVAMPNFANWTISLYHLSTVVNRTLCFNTTFPEGAMCTWNTTKYCSGECEGYRLILNATDTDGNRNGVAVENITIDNIPPSLTNFDTRYVDNGFNARANVTDNYLQRVNAFVLTEGNYSVVSWDHLCGETQEGNCSRSESGMFNRSWAKEIYSINDTQVPINYGYCPDCSIVPGCFKQNDSVGYDCGEEQDKFYLIFNNSGDGNEKPLLGLGKYSWCSQDGCTLNTDLILNGESKFKPLAKQFNSSNENLWNYYDTPEITLYDISGGENLNLSAESANSTYKFMLEPSDYVSTLDVMGQPFNSDATPPSIGMEFNIPPTHYTNHNWIEANVTASDSESGLHKIIIYLYNQTRLINSTNSSTSPFFVNFTNLPEGTYFLNASANDNAGNSNQVQTQTITVDTRSPLVNIISPTSRSYNTGNIVVNISATDQHLDKIWFYNGVDNEIYVDPIVKTFSEGSFTLYAYANDTAGNSNSANVAFTVDLTNPVYSNFNVSSTAINSSDTLNIFANWVETNPDKAVLYVNGHPTTTILLTDLVNFTWIPGGGADVEKWFNFSIYANDTSGRHNQTSEIPVFVRDTTGPIIYLLSPQANALTNSSSFTFVYNNSDISIRNCSLYIDDVLNETNSSVVPNTISSFGPKTLSEGAHTWKVECYDNSDNLGTSAVQDFTTDLTLPSYSSVNEMPAQPTSYSADQIYRFNITWTDANGINSARIVWNGTTYASPRVYNLSDVYLFNISSLPAGTYNYTWYATDNAGNVNNTGNFEYAIDKFTSECSLNFNPVSPIAYATPVNVSCSCTNPEASAILLRNGTNVTSQKNLFVVLGAGDYNYTCYVPATQNYTSALNQSSYTVETISPILTLYSQSWSATYGTRTNVSCTANTNQVTPRLFRNSEVNAIGDYALLGVGTYNYVCNSTATQNYTANTTSNALTIEKADDQLNITLNNHVNQNISVAYPTRVNVSGSSLSGTHNIYRNGTEVTETSELLAVGWWEYKINSTGNQNYTESAGSTYYAQVNKTASAVNLLLNGAANNITVNISQQVNITATLVTGEGFIELYQDENLIGNDTSQITNITSYRAEGVHEFSVTSPETQNFSVSYKTYYATVKDVVAPNVTLLQPGNNTYRNSNNVTFSFNATDDASGIANCSLYVDGMLKSTKTDVAINEENNISVVIGSGSRSWYVKCYDNSSNKNLGQSDTWIVKVDTQSPLTEIIGVSGGMTYYDNVTITLVATDYPVGGSGINKTEYNLTGEWEDYSTPINVTTDGIYTIYYRTLDNAGNREATKSLAFTVDKTPPTDNITNPADQGNVSGTVNFNATSDGNCVRFYVDDMLKLSDTSEPYTYVWDTSQESDGEHELKSTAYDGGCGFGNSNTTTITVYARNTAPTSNITSPANNYLTNASVNITGTAVGNGADISSVEVWDGADWNSATGTTSWNYTFNPGSSGTYNIKSKATDALGNIETPGAGINIVFDVDAPTISNLQITPNPAAQNSDVFVSAKVTDVNGVAQVNATLDGTTETLSSSEGNIYRGTFTSPSSDGTYELTISARDNAGNYGSSSAELEVNSTIPIITILPVNESVMKNGTAIIINVSNSDVSYYNLSTDGIIHDFTNSVSFTASGADSEFVLFVYANRTSGASASKTYNYKIDNTNPVVNIFAATTPTNSSIQQISGNVSDDNLNDVIINGAAAILSGNNFSRNMSLNEGNNTITVVAFDKAGNNGTSTTSIFLDTHTPTTSYSLSGTSGSNGWYTSNVTVSFTVNDSSSSSGYYIQYDSGSGWTNGTSVVLTSSGTVYYGTIDYAGNIEPVKSLTVNIDKIKPSLNSLTLSDSLPPINSSVKITANVTDDNLNSVKVQIDSTIYNTSLVSQDIYEYDFIPTEQKTYNVTIIADDVAGNVNDSVVEQFTAAIQQKDIVDSIGNETITRSYSDVGIDIDFLTNATTELNVTVSKFSDEPTNVSALSNGVNFFYINTSSLENVTWVFVKIYYTHADIVGLDESTLKMTWYNQTSDEWVTLSAGNPAWVYDTGVNTGDNYVWANMTHFSIYGIFGSPISQTPSTLVNNIGPSGGAVSEKTTTTSTQVPTASTTTTTSTQVPTASTTTTAPEKTLPKIEIPYTLAMIIIAVILIAIFIIFFRRK